MTQHQTVVVRFIIFAMMILASYTVRCQNFFDYAAVNSGAWNSLSTWRQWDGTGWNSVPSVTPNSPTATVYILAGRTVTLTGAGPYTCGSIYIESTARLYSNNSTALVPLNIWGADLICDGEIGRSGLNDGISLQIEGPSCTIFGSGSISAARLIKSTATNVTTNLSIYSDITLRWEGINNTVLYNAAGTASFFNLTLYSGYTLNCIGGTANPGSVAIDGFKSASAGDAAGTFTIRGTLIVAGILYASNTNTTPGYTCNFIIETGGTIRTNQINSVSSNGVVSGFTVASEAILELTGPKAFATDSSLTWGTGNNRYSFLPGSTVIYSGSSDQKVSVTGDFNNFTAPNNQYWNLVIRGGGTKSIRPGNLNVRGNLSITGTAVLDQETNDPNMTVGGDWSAYGSAAFLESTDSLATVRFDGNGAAPGTADQHITCPGGETFTNLWISKAVNGAVVLNSPVTVQRQLTLGQNGTSNFGILRLSGQPLTINHPSASAIRLTGAPGVFRFIVSDDTASGSSGEVRWNIGTSVTAVPGTAWPWPYVIPFGISAAHDTLPFGFCKSTSADMGMLRVSTYGTAENNLPLPAPVTHLLSAIPANNQPDNRLWTADRYWRIQSTLPVTGIGAAFSYNRRAGTSSESPQNDSLPSRLKAQYWSGGRWAQPAVGSAFPSGSTVAVTTLPASNAVWTLSSDLSPLGNCIQGTSHDTASAFCSYLWNGTVYTQTGNYFRTFPLASGCDSVATLTLTVDTVNRITGTIQPASCFGSSNGSIAVSLTASPSDSVSYSWSTGSTANNLSGLPAGSYQLQVIDRYNCIAGKSFTVTQPSVLNATATPSATQCTGDSSGTVQLSVSGGTVPYSFLWSNGSTSKDISNLVGGSYNVSVSDANGCTTTAAASINTFPPIRILSFSPSSGNTGDTITISGYGLSGATAVSFGNTVTLPLSSNDSILRVIVPANAPTNLITVTGTYGCRTVSDSMFISLSGPALLTVRVILEGYYQSGGMWPVMANRGIGNSNTDVDTLFGFLTDTVDGTVLIASSTAVLQTSGYAAFQFDNSLLGQRYHLMVCSGNSLRTWSATPLTVLNTFSYDFTVAASAAYGSNQREMSPGVWAVYTGDMSRDDYIDAFDYPLYLYDNIGFATGYFQTDLNGDGYTDAFDYPIYLRNLLDFVQAAHP
jgi:hypothetical protein